MGLVLFVNTILPLNSLNITVFVNYVSSSKVNRKDRSRPCFFVCLFCFTLQNKLIKLVVSVTCSSLKQTEEVCVDLHDHGNHNSPSHKSSCSIIGSLSYSAELQIVFFFIIMWDE